MPPTMGLSARHWRSFIKHLSSRTGTLLPVNSCTCFILSYQISHELYRCLAHILNLGIVAVMDKVTSIAAVETTQGIWEYDPNDESNRVLGGNLDVIAAIRTLAVKIQASGQRIQYFHQLQLECEIKRPLSITLHGNTRWGTAYGMIDRALQLKTVRHIPYTHSYAHFFTPSQLTASSPQQTSVLATSLLSGPAARQ